MSDRFLQSGCPGSVVNLIPPVLSITSICRKGPWHLESLESLAALGPAGLQGVNERTAIRESTGTGGFAGVDQN
jgi:hypothetical protein